MLTENLEPITSVRHLKSFSVFKCCHFEKVEHRRLLRNLWEPGTFQEPLEVLYLRDFLKVLSRYFSFIFYVSDKHESSLMRYDVDDIVEMTHIAVGAIRHDIT